MWSITAKNSASLIFKCVAIIIAMPVSTAPEDLSNRVNSLEKGHEKLMDLKEELRIISMEYADIRFRMEATDTLIDHLVHQLSAESKMRRMTLLLTIAILAMVAVLIALTVCF